MKAIVIGLYVVCVLLFSAFAHAEGIFNPIYINSDKTIQQMQPASANIHIEDVQMADNYSLEISGLLPSPCYKAPSASLTVDAQAPNVLILHLTSPLPTQACVSPVATYVTTVSLPLLAQKAGLALVKKAHYLVKTEGFNFAVEVTGAELLSI